MAEKQRAPADNLYKFLDTAGLVLYLGAMFEHSYRIDALAQQISQATVQVTELQEDTKAFQNTIMWLQEVSPRPVSVQMTVDSLSERVRRNRTRTVARIDMLLRIERRDRLADEQFYLTTFLCFVISALGFWFWYTRVQKYQDLSVKRQGSIDDFDSAPPTA